MALDRFHLGGLRSVELAAPDLAAQERFYVETWGLRPVARTDTAVYLRGTGAAHHILSLHEGEAPGLRSVTFAAHSVADLEVLAARILRHGGRLESGPAGTREPGGGVAIAFRDPEGRSFRAIAGDDRHAITGSERDRPERLAHVVLNAPDVGASSAFLIEALGFRLTDRTRMMTFVRTSSDHHSIAFARAENRALNHIAFLMPELESVMRGAGRMRDAGYPIEWGVGRHGPGHNVFAYFIAPGGVPVEYTAEVEAVDDSYRVGGPDDWNWPPGRMDHWGISAPPSERLKQAQSRVVFL